MVRKIDDHLITELSARFGERFSTSHDVLRQHGTDESYHPGLAPNAVVFPQTVEEVAEAVKICARHHSPVIAFGAGTSFEGHVAALEGGVSVDLNGLNQILSLRPQDLDVTVEAGVTRRQLDAHLRQSGLFFPIDPGADATLGGMAATGASGTTTVRYGSMRDNVLSLKVVLADGSVIRTSSRARKSSSGYDLTRLFVGSEGTLGIICELTLRIFGVPEAISAATCAFATFEGAVECVIEAIQMGIPVARVELLDEVMLDGVNRLGGSSYPLAPTLFFEFHGSQSSVSEQAEGLGEIAKRHGAKEFEWATTQEERNRLWRARHDALYAALALRPGSRAFPTDVCVPISALAECIIETKKDLESSFLIAPLVGHVGDGNFHVAFIIDPNIQEELEEAKRLNDRMVRRALAMDGTITGEHGVGYGKKEYLLLEHGSAVEVMRSIKSALDPHGLMNPGKIIPNSTSGPE